MLNFELVPPTAAAKTTAEPPRPRSVRRAARPIFDVLAVLLVAGVLLVSYQLGVLGGTLSMLLVGMAVAGLAITITRLVRRRAHTSWLREPFRPGSRRFAVQFLVRAILWLVAAYAAALAFPRSLTGAGEAKASYAVIWGAAVMLIVCGLAPARKLNWVRLAAAGAAIVAISVPIVQLTLPATDSAGLGNPLRGTWMATSAGRSGLVNHHYTVAQQRDALDLALPFSRSSSHLPTDLPAYPAYEQPVYAPIDGVVVRMRDGEPDQLIGQRDSTRPLGNYLVLDAGGGRYVLLAHLRPHAFRVSEGDPVRRGQMVAEVGNSGNSTEPHLHLQLQSGIDIVSDSGRPTPGLVTFPISFEDAVRVRGGRSSSPARNLRSNDLVMFR